LGFGNALIRVPAELALSLRLFWHLFRASGGSGGGLSLSRLLRVRRFKSRFEGGIKKLYYLIIVELIAKDKSFKVLIF
jgi:hypothetical protein